MRWVDREHAYADTEARQKRIAVENLSALGERKFVNKAPGKT